MKKSLLTISLAVITVLAFSNVANAATVTYTKPTIKVNTSQEESVLSKKMKEIEAKQAEAKAKVEANKENWEKAKQDAKAQSEANKAAAKARQEQRAKAMDDFKNSLKF